jgi:methyl-accepting chemotaxis protein
MFKKISLTVRLVLAFIGVAVIVLIVGLLGFSSTARLNDLSQSISKVHVLNGKLLMREIEHLKWAQTVMNALSSKKDKIEVEKDPTKCNFGKWYYGDERKVVEAEFPEMKKYIESIEKPHRELHESVVELELLLKEANFTGAEDIYMHKTSAALTQVQGDLGNMRTHLGTVLEKDTKEHEIAVNDALVQGYSGTGIGIFLAMLLGGLGSFMSFSLSKKIRGNVKELTVNADNLTLSSKQISMSSQQLSTGASELASSIEEMTSSLEELQSIIESNTKNVNQTKMMTNEAGGSAEISASQMQEMMGAMLEIENNNNRVAKIIKVIDDIAFQTNILALNAAVEAARAGDAGRGFAVVADQVKSLAQKSADAAKETAALIEGAVGSVSNGKNVSETVLNSIVSVKEILEKIRLLMDETDRASQEQLKGAGQITKAVSEVNGVVQATASSSEENAAAGEQLYSQAETLREIVINLSKIVGGGGSVKKGEDTAKMLLTDKSAEVQDVHLKKVSAVHSQHITLNNSGVEIIRPEDKIPMDDFKDF